MAAVRVRVLRCLALLFAATLIAVGLQVVGLPSPAAAAPAGCVGEQADAAAAQRMVEICGRRVEILSERTEYSQVFAQADGSRTLEQSVEPQRVRQHGGWVPVDTTLKRTATGVVPKATVLPMTFSNGGDTLVGRLVDGKREITLRWPSALPKPKLKGDTAIYPGVFPDVDLRVTATATGFSEVLVVRTRNAGASPDLTSLTFGLDTKGIALRKTAAGGLSAHDTSGAEVFSAPAPLMWDSSESMEQQAIEPDQTRPNDLGPSGEDTQGDRVRQAVMPVKVGAESVTITPDKAMLTDPRTEFPVYIDPLVTGTMSGGAWTSVWSKYPTKSFWKNTTALTDASITGAAGVGRTEDCTGCADHIIRSFFRMDMTGVKGAVSDAKFIIEQRWSWTCNPASNARVWRMGTGITSATTWNNPPKSWGKYATVLAKRKYGAVHGCIGAGPIEFDVTKMVSDSDSTVTFGMKAIDESTKNQWKRYKPSTARLSVTYNSKPYALSEQKTNSAGECKTGSARPYVTKTSGVTVSGKQADPDKEAELTTSFYLWNTSTPTSKTTVTKSGGNGVAVTGTLPTLTEGATYGWNAKTRDRAANATDVMEAWSEKTCEFTVDSTKPPAPGGLSSTDYSSAVPSGGVGYAGTFTIAAPVLTDLSEEEAKKRKQDIASYAWTLDGGVKTDAGTVAVNATDFTGSITLTPRTDGLKTLRVWSKDRAGNVSAEVSYTFTVLHGSGPAAGWDFDDAENTTTSADVTGHGNTLTLSGGTRVTGRGNDGSALSLNGTSGYAATAGPVTFPNVTTGTAVTVRSDASFTVTARVKLASTATGTGQNIAVAAGGSRVFSYSLGNAQSDSKWRFSMANTDADNATVVSAVSNVTATAGKWTHLAGVYDASTKLLTLYVNGVAQTTTATLTTGFNATGPVTIGKRKWNGVDGGYLNGAVDDAQVYPTVAKTADIVTAAKPLPPAITFPDGAEVPANGTLKVTLDAEDDTNVTKFRYNIDSGDLVNAGTTVNLTTAGGSVTLNLSVGSLRDSRPLYAAAEDANGQGPADQRTFVVVAPASLDGWVTDEGGKFIENAVVVMTLSTGGSTSYTTQTDVNGAYNFPDVPTGNYIVKATADGRCGSAGTQPKLVDRTGASLRITLYRIKDAAGYLCTVRTATFATGTTVLALTGDDAATKVTLPFSFPFYGSAFQDLCVDTNGLITFTLSTACVSYPNTGNRQLGSTAEPNGGLIAPFWDDLVVDSSANVRTAVSGTGATQQVLIEWNNVHRKGDTSQRLSFSVTLGADGAITTNYAGLDNAVEQGDNALVGTESPTGDVGFSYSTGEPVLNNGTAVVIADENTAALEVHNLTGKVTNAAGAAVSGATVTLDPGGLSTTSAADGSYTFYGLIADSYTVTSKQAGRCAAKAEAVVDLAADVVQNLQYGADYGLMGYACTVGTSGYVAADTNTGLSGDDVETTVYLPFSMPFYGRSHTYATVSTNGWIGIGGGYLTPLWSDLVIDDQAAVLTAARGTTPNRSFVIEWRNAQFVGSTDRTTFQAVLHEDGRVVYHYGAMTTDVQKGSTSTVGMVAMSFRTTAYYSEWEPALTANSSITYTPAASGVIAGVLTEAVSTEPIAGRTITLNPSGQTTTTGADGSYQFAGVSPGAYYVLASATDDRCLGQYATAEVYKSRADAKTDLSINNDADPYYTCTVTAQTYIAGANVQTAWTGDDAAWQATAPFPVKLYGESTTTPWISSNGFLTFGPEGATSPDATAIPAEAEDGTPNAALYPFWHDWVVDSSAAIATRTSGTAPNRQWVVEWRNVASYGDDEVRTSFEILFGEDGTVTFAYAGIDDNPVERGAEGTVGVENPGGTTAFQYLYSADLLYNGLGVKHTPKITETGYVNGMITCAGQPVDGAVVTVGGQSLTTSSDGGYFIGDVPAKTQTVLVTVPSGACAGTVTRTVLIGEPMQAVDFTLQATAQGTGYTLAETDTAYTALGSDTVLAGGYNTWTTVELPFAVQLYGQSYSSMSVGTEGTLDFTGASLLPFRGDWEADSQSSIRTAVRGTAPNRQYVVEWRDLRHHTDTNTRVTFQAILDEAGGFSYVYPGTDTSYLRSGGVSTIGLRTNDGSAALIYADRLTALRPGVALRIDPTTTA